MPSCVTCTMYMPGVNDVASRIQSPSTSRVSFAEGGGSGAADDGAAERRRNPVLRIGGWAHSLRAQVDPRRGGARRRQRCGWGGGRKEHVVCC